MEHLYQTLVNEALDARRFSYCPYSGFAVGAALLTKDEAIYTGSNIENATFGATNCAERTAFFKAVSEGEDEFYAIAIAGGKKDCSEEEMDYCPPCGICRQVMAEFCEPDFKVILVKNSKEFKIMTLKELLPLSFSL